MSGRYCVTAARGSVRMTSAKLVSRSGGRTASSEQANGRKRGCFFGPRATFAGEMSSSGADPIGYDTRMHSDLLTDRTGMPVAKRRSLPPLCAPVRCTPPALLDQINLQIDVSPRPLSTSQSLNQKPSTTSPNTPPLLPPRGSRFHSPDKRPSHRARTP